MKLPSTNSVFFYFLIIVMALFAFSCKKNVEMMPPNMALTADIGGVFVQTNQSSGNRVLQYSRSTEGKLTFVDSYDTRGLGTGAGLGNQGSITLSEDGRILLVTNAQSNDISSFKIDNNKLVLVGVYPSGGIKPISITQKGNKVYVLNVTSDQVSGFFISEQGELSPIQNAIQSLSGVNVLGSQISFVYPDVLVVTERRASKISTFVLNSTGAAGNRQTVSSFSATPFGFGVGNQGKIYVTEENAGIATGGQLSSYMITASGAINFISTLRSAELGLCWGVVNKSETIAFATNTTSNTISSFMIDQASGMIKTHSIAQNVGPAYSPIDLALSKKDNFLYVLNTTANKIIGYSVTDGLLTIIPGAEISGLPIGTNGIAVY